MSTYILTLCLQWKYALRSGAKRARKDCCLVVLVHLHHTHRRPCLGSPGLGIAVLALEQFAEANIRPHYQDFETYT